MQRRTATKVRGGRVQKQNDWRPARDDYWLVRPDQVVFDRRRPSPGHRHLVTKEQVGAVLRLLPDWDEVAVGLRAIVLDWDTGCFGWYQQGVVALCNWPQNLWKRTDPGWVADNAELLDLLGVEVAKVDGERELRWTEAQARAFLLLDVLPHELGHHHDLMTTRSRADAARGEPYAYAYARRALKTLWPRIEPALRG